MKAHVLFIILLAIGASLLVMPSKTTVLAKATETYSVEDGKMINLEAGIVSKDINGKTYKMYAYDGQIPGPTIRVKKNSTIFINFTNNIDMETTVHWHGLRHKNQFDGVPMVTQDPIKPGENFMYELYFPDTGIYWYHPHVREDIQQEKGLYGNMLVESENNSDKEVVLVLDDILIEDGEISPFRNEFTNFALMGRFGNTMLINGKERFDLDVKKGEIVRFYITNTANTRPFNFSIQGVPLKIVGSDMSLYEKEFFSGGVVIGPAERYIVDVLFNETGTFEMKNINPIKEYLLGTIQVEQNESEINYLFSTNENKDVMQDIDKYRKYFDKDVDYNLTLTIDMNGMVMQMPHDDETIEWEDTMFDMNRAHNNKMMRWVMQDEVTKKQNMNITYDVSTNSIKKIRIYNNPDSDHPMQHTIHLHGQRFLVIEQDGVKKSNLVWKDTVFIPKGSYVDMLVDFTNPGDWMMHCHIAEHLESGMMMSFKVTEEKL